MPGDEKEKEGVVNIQQPKQKKDSGGNFVDDVFEDEIESGLRHASVGPGQFGVLVRNSDAGGSSH